MFERLWSNFDLRTRPKAEGIESMTVDIPLTPDEARAGGHAQVLVPARVGCPVCQGHGGMGLHQCWECQGQGAVSAEYPVAVPYPAGLQRDYVVRVPLAHFGIHNFFLTVRFRPTAIF